MKVYVDTYMHVQLFCETLLTPECVLWQGPGYKDDTFFWWQGEENITKCVKVENTQYTHY